MLTITHKNCESSAIRGGTVASLNGENCGREKRMADDSQFSQVEIWGSGTGGEGCILWAPTVPVGAVYTPGVYVSESVIDEIRNKAVKTSYDTVDMREEEPQGSRRHRTRRRSRRVLEWIQERHDLERVVQWEWYVFYNEGTAGLKADFPLCCMRPPFYRHDLREQKLQFIV